MLFPSERAKIVTFFNCLIVHKNTPQALKDGNISVRPQYAHLPNYNILNISSFSDRNLQNSWTFSNYLWSLEILDTPRKDGKRPRWRTVGTPPKIGKSKHIALWRSWRAKIGKFSNYLIVPKHFGHANKNLEQLHLGTVGTPPKYEILVILSFCDRDVLKSWTVLIIWWAPEVLDTATEIWTARRGKVRTTTIIWFFWISSLWNRNEQKSWKLQIISRSQKNWTRA